VNRAESQKRRAAERAVEFVESGMKLGLGTGSTARHVVELIAARIADGTLSGIVAVPTSRATEMHARSVHVPLTTLNHEPHLDLTLDGADEIGPGLDLIKGHGGALLWEKMVAEASSRLLIVADASKLVSRVGERMALPVEVVPFGWATHLPVMTELGAHPVLRCVQGEPVVTDSGNYLIDCRFEHGIADPVGVSAALKARTGIVETGLFIGMAHVAVVASDDNIRVIERETATWP
jgi:ribose 5-phosphate isomerase A